MKTVKNTVWCIEDLHYYAKKDLEKTRGEFWRDLSTVVGKTSTFIPQTIGDQNWLFFSADLEDALEMFCQEDNPFEYKTPCKAIYDYWLNGIRVEDSVKTVKGVGSKTYSAKDVKITWGGKTLKGFAPDSSVTVRKENNL